MVALDNRIVSTGYNGAATGEPHCDVVGHDLQQLADGTENCIRAVHAEQNALLEAARSGRAVGGSTLYCDTYPCWLCFRAIMTAGIVRVVFEGSYKNDPRVWEAATRQGIVIDQWQGRDERLTRVAGKGEFDEP